MGPGDREHLLSEAVSALGHMARSGSTEAGQIVSLLLEGKVPERISDGLFDELLDRSAPAYLIEYARFGATVSELRESGRNNLAERGEEKRGRILNDAAALENLMMLGFLPSPDQRALMVRMFAEVNTSRRPIDYERPHIFQGIENSRSILFNAIARMMHALDRGQCALMLESCENTGERFGLIGSWAERAPGQSEIAELFERELSRILGDRDSQSSERVRAFAIRRQMEELRMGKPKPVPADAQKPLRPPARKV